MADELEKDQVEPTEQEQQGQEQEQQGEEQEQELKDRIAVDVEDIGTLRRRVTVTVPREVIDERTEKSYGDLSSEAAIPGFRKGRAPKTLIEKRFGKQIGDEVKGTLLSESYEAAVAKAELDVLGQPDIDVEKVTLPQEGDLTYSFEVELKPEFDLPNLEGVQIKKPKIEVAEEDVDREVQRIRGLRGQYQPVDEPIQQDDMIVGDIVVTADGQEVSKTEDTSLFARPRVVEGMTLENFGEVMIGAKPGESRTLEGTLPEDYQKEELRGKTATIEVTVKQVKRMVVPELSQEVLSSMGFDSEQELRDLLRQQLTGRIDQEIRRAMRQQVEEYLLGVTSVELPENLSNRQTERAVMRRVLQMRNQGTPEDEVQKQMDELRVQAAEQTRNDLKLFFIMNKIAEELDIDINEGEVNSRIAAIAQMYGRRFDRMRDDMMKDGSIESLVLEIRDAKVVDTIIEKANVVEEEAPQQENQ